jgi:hypothetical protein
LKGTSAHVALELTHVEPVDQRSGTRKADGVWHFWERAGQRHDALKRVAQTPECRLLFLVGVKHVIGVIFGRCGSRRLAARSERHGQYARSWVATRCAKCTIPIAIRRDTDAKIVIRFRLLVEGVNHSWILKYPAAAREPRLASGEKYQKTTR